MGGKWAVWCPITERGGTVEEEKGTVWEGGVNEGSPAD